MFKKIYNFVCVINSKSMSSCCYGSWASTKMVKRPINFIFVVTNSRQELFVLRMGFSKIDARRFLYLEVSLWILRLFICTSRVIMTWCRSCVFILLERDKSAFLFFLFTLLPFDQIVQFWVDFFIDWICFVSRSNSSLPFGGFNEATAFLLSVTRFVSLWTAHQLFQFIIIWCRIIFLLFRQHKNFSCSFSISRQESSLYSTGRSSERWILGPIFNHVILGRWNPRVKLRMFISKGVILVFWDFMNRNTIDLVKIVLEIGILNVITLDTEFWLSQIECIFHPVGDHFVNSWNFLTLLGDVNSLFIVI